MVVGLCCLWLECIGAGPARPVTVGEAKTFRPAARVCVLVGWGMLSGFLFSNPFCFLPALWWVGVVVSAGRVLLLLLFVVGCGVVGLLVNCIVVASIFVFCFLCFVSFFGRMVDALAS